MSNNKTTYRPLGNFIREVNVRNSDLKVTKLLGLSMTKEFRTSTSNIVGVDLSRYKVVGKNIFAFDPMSVIRVHKVPIAMNDSDEKIIVSPTYYTFECIDENKLNPQYLMMLFRRSEFDRFADFKSDAAVRGGYDWDELCETQIPLPTKDEQQRIVNEYNTITQRIALNEQMCAKLEETAQTLYRNMFVDGIDKERLPEGWKMGTLGDWGSIVTGKTPSSDDPEDFGNDVLFITPGDFKGDKFIIRTERYLSICGAEKLKSKIVKKGDLVVTCIGSDMGKVSITTEDCITNQQINSINVSYKEYREYLYYLLSSMKQQLLDLGSGSSTLPLLNKSEFEKIEVCIPSQEILQKFTLQMKPISKMIYTKQKENEVLTKMLSMVMAKMGR